MKIEEAKKLAKVLQVRTHRGDPFLFAEIDEKEGAIVFHGGKHGTHQLFLNVSSEERVRAHWEGYVENQGFKPLQVGDSVTFPSKSSPSGRRSGIVTSIGPCRAKVAFTYCSGRRMTLPIPLGELGFRSKGW